jgi:hypothetical protein
VNAARVFYVVAFDGVPTVPDANMFTLLFLPQAASPVRVIS